MYDQYNTGAEFQQPHEVAVRAAMARIVYEIRDGIRRLAWFKTTGRTLTAEQVKRLRQARAMIDELLKDQGSKAA